LPDTSFALVYRWGSDAGVAAAKSKVWMSDSEEDSEVAPSSSHVNLMKVPMLCSSICSWRPVQWMQLCTLVQYSADKQARGKLWLTSYTLEGLFSLFGNCFLLAFPLYVPALPSVYTCIQTVTAVMLQCAQQAVQGVFEKQGMLYTDFRHE